MGRASKICNTPGCPNLQPCATHPKVPWAGSTRRGKTGSGTKQQARARRVLTRDRGICHVCGRSGADQADHVVPLAEGGADTLDNMAAIHAKPCHERKTQAEAARARAHTRANTE